MEMNRPERQTERYNEIYIITINKLNVDTRVTNVKNTMKNRLKRKRQEDESGVFMGHITHLLTG